MRINFIPLLCILEFCSLSQIFQSLKVHSFYFQKPKEKKIISNAYIVYIYNIYREIPNLEGNCVARPIFLEHWCQCSKMLLDLEDKNKLCSPALCPRLSSLKAWKCSVLTYHKTVKHRYSILIIFNTPNFDLWRGKLGFLGAAAASKHPLIHKHQRCSQSYI